MQPLLCSVVVAVSTLSLAAAQELAGRQAAPSFEVASVRQNTTGDRESSARWFPGGRFVAVNARLDHLVLEAFGIHPGLAHVLVEGGIRPEMRCLRGCSSRDEILSARFDIQATTPGDVPVAQQPLVLRALLEGRFKLKARLEKRDAPVYALTVAREGRLGPQLRPSSHDCGVFAKQRSEARSRGAAAPPMPIGSDGKPLCLGPMDLSRMSEFVYVRKSAGPLFNLVSGIRGDLPLPLIDRTGLTGNFEWELTSAMPASPDFKVNPNVPSLDVALREQLGLRLMRVTEPLEKLVIESVAMPTQN